MSDKSILTRLDEYIEFAEARKCFSDVGFYRDCKSEIYRLKQQLAEVERDAARYHYIRGNHEWTRQGTLQDDDSCALIQVRFPYLANFSCAAMLDYNIDKMMQPQGGEDGWVEVRKLKRELAEMQAENAELQKWKDAVDHELVTMGLTAGSYSSAKEAVNALTQWHVDVALDPRVVAQDYADIDEPRPYWMDKNGESEDPRQA